MDLSDAFLDNGTYHQVTTIPNCESSCTNNSLDKSNTSRKGLFDIAWDKDTRISVLWIQIILGTVGGLVVCGWLWCNRRRKSRVNVILLHVTLSDLLVMAAALIQVTWEMVDRQWLAGEAMCRIIKFYQSFSMMASSNMMVLLSIDRHQAIRSPLRNPPDVWKMALPCWLVAALLSCPMFFMYRVRFEDKEDKMFFNKTICESLLYDRPPIHGEVFLTSMSIIHIYIPCLIVAICYIRIVLKIAEKAKRNSKPSSRSGAVLLQSTQSTAIPKAKIKTLKMTIVIVTTFILCGLPYHTMNLISNFLGPDYVSPLAAAILGALPVANSVVNPYIFLSFNASLRHWRGHSRNQNGNALISKSFHHRQAHVSNTPPNASTTKSKNRPPNHQMTYVPLRKIVKHNNKVNFDNDMCA